MRCGGVDIVGVSGNWKALLLLLKKKKKYFSLSLSVSSKLLIVLKKKQVELLFVFELELLMCDSHSTTSQKKVVQEFERYYLILRLLCFLKLKVVENLNYYYLSKLDFSERQKKKDCYCC